jgi:hypothetical protein
VQFQSTLPAHAAELMHTSEFERNTVALAGDATSGYTRLSGLGTTLLQDLQRFVPGPGDRDGIDALEVLAAALRHGRALQLFLELDYRVIPLTVWPRDREFSSPLELDQLLQLRLPDLRVLRVERAAQFTTDLGAAATEADAGKRQALGPFIWELSLRGARESLLPEIGGRAAYRVTPGTQLQTPRLDGTLAGAVERLRHGVVSLTEIAGWPGFDRQRGIRLLNALYLHSALIVTRTHPAAFEPG